MCFFLFLLNMVGCAYYQATYDINLSAVERPTDAKDRYGEQQIVSFEDQGLTKYRFEDEMVEIVWLPMATEIGFELRNKTTHSMKIIWDESVYVDELGESKRIMHSGVKYIEKGNPQPPTVVVRGASVFDVILPIDNVSYESGKYGGWEKGALFPEKTASGADTNTASLFENRVKALVGKTVQVLLALKIEDVVNEYIFSFVINDYKIRKISQ